MKYRLLIFDWDGTLMDSADRIVECFQSAIALTDLSPRTNDQIKHIIGLGLNEAMMALYPETDQPRWTQLADLYRLYYLELNKTPNYLFGGVKETLEKLRQQGFILALATGKSRRGLDRVLEETEIGHLFQVTRCADETCSKPDPLMLNQILEETGITNHQALMIGDSEYDLQMANNANIDSAAVSYGVHSCEHLLNYRPITCLHSMKDLWEFLHERK
jgi:phosphoglycolate phosphatase